MTTEETTALHIAVAKALGAYALECPHSRRDGCLWCITDDKERMLTLWHASEQEAWTAYGKTCRYTTDPAAILMLMDEIRKCWGVVEIKRGPFPGQVTCAIFRDAPDDRVDGWRGSAVGETTGEAVCRAFVTAVDETETESK